VRAALLLITGLAGCDQVWGLERPDAGPPSDKNDEDLDGIANSLDPCPHLAVDDSTDDDQDGIPAICDVDDTKASVAVFFGFDAEGIPAALEIQGSTASDTPGTITIGNLGDTLDTITLKNVTAKTSLMDVGFEVIEDTVEADPASATYNELGLHAANTSYAPSTRGDTCFFGRLRESESMPLYTELVENEGAHQQKRYSGALVGASGRMRLVRTPEMYECTVVRTGEPTIRDTKDVQFLQMVPGKLGLSTFKVRVRLRYLYYAYEPLL